jgi:hypothetical protein
MKYGTSSQGGVFGQLNTMAAKHTASYRLGKPEPTLYPIIEGPIIVDLTNKKKERVPWVHVIFTVNFGKARKRLVQEFDRWLQLPENKARFDAHKQNPTGRTGAFKDRLKDLAAWRLYRELGCTAALAFAEENRKRDTRGKPRQFHDARKEQSKATMPLSEAPLYSEESGFLRAKARALNYLAELIPSEFGRRADNPEKSANDLAKVFRDALKRARKISKSSS